MGMDLAAFQYGLGCGNDDSWNGCVEIVAVSVDGAPVVVERDAAEQKGSPSRT